MKLKKHFFTKTWYKTLGKEQLLHNSVCNYIDYQYPNIFYFHPHNESKRSIYERYMIKIMRLRPGMPDLMFPMPNKGRTGMALEFKIKPNKLTEKQLDIMNILSSYNWKVIVCYTFDQAKMNIDQYFSIKHNNEIKKQIE